MIDFSAWLTMLSLAKMQLKMKCVSLWFYTIMLHYGFIKGNIFQTFFLLQWSLSFRHAHTEAQYMEHTSAELLWMKRDLASQSLSLGP